MLEICLKILNLKDKPAQNSNAKLFEVYLLRTIIFNNNLELIIVNSNSKTSNLSLGKQCEMKQENYPHT